MFLFKLATIIFIIAGGLAGGFAAVRIGVGERGKRLLSLGNAFAGGIFLGAGLIHMLSDASDKFESFAGNMDYPFAALICGCGFLLVLCLEKVLARGEDVGATSEKHLVSPLLLLVVLSVHSVIAGVSLGLEATLVSSAVIFVAIIAHKSSAAFALGASLKTVGMTSRSIAGTIAFFSIMTPLGILLGSAFGAWATSLVATKVEAVFDALAAGTFLYVAILDIIEEVFENPEDRCLKFMLMTASFGLMALIAVWT